MSDPTDYKATLNLPKTDFPMRGGLPKKEPEIMAHWESLDLYKKLRAERKQKSSLQSELKTASDYSQVAEESMSQTIDKQHTKNLDLLHALATVSQHYQNRRAGDSDGTNPAD